MLFIPVRHCSPSGAVNLNARLRIGTLLSGAYGFPPGNANRPTTGVLTFRKNGAVEYLLASPFPSK